MRPDINVCIAVFLGAKQRDLAHGYVSIAVKMECLFVLTLEQTCFFSRDPLISRKQATLIHGVISQNINFSTAMRRSPSVSNICGPKIDICLSRTCCAFFNLLVKV